MKDVYDALRRDGDARVVGLVGASGVGTTTAASEIVRSSKTREFFSDGIVWLTVNEGAKERLSLLMNELATTVHEDVLGSVGIGPTAAKDGATYVKKRMKEGQGGQGLRCLVVADNVWEAEVITKLREIGMWTVVTTRNQGLVTDEEGGAVGIDTLAEEEALSVLRESSELPTGTLLPEAARELIHLCGHVVMDLAFDGVPFTGGRVQGLG